MLLKKDDAYKLYYTVNEVAEKYGFEASKLRYWESVFPMLKPQKRHGDRIYTQADLAILDEIVYLVEHKQHKLTAARDLMASGKSHYKKITQAVEQLELVRLYLQNMRELMG